MLCCCSGILWWTSKGTICFSCMLREETWNSINYHVFIQARDTSVHYPVQSRLSHFLFQTLKMVCHPFKHLLEEVITAKQGVIVQDGWQLRFFKYKTCLSRDPARTWSPNKQSVQSTRQCVAGDNSAVLGLDRQPYPSLTSVILGW